jgi:hypothetical protein
MSNSLMVFVTGYSAYVLGMVKATVSLYRPRPMPDSLEAS